MTPDEQVEAIREVVRAGLRKCRVEDGSPAPLIHAADLPHITHMVTTELLTSDAFRALVAGERAAALREAADEIEARQCPDEPRYAINDACYRIAASIVRERADRETP